MAVLSTYSNVGLNYVLVIDISITYFEKDVEKRKCIIEGHPTYVITFRVWQALGESKHV